LARKRRLRRVKKFLRRVFGRKYYKWIFVFANTWHIKLLLIYIRVLSCFPMKPWLLYKARPVPKPQIPRFYAQRRCPRYTHRERFPLKR
jgi:hypothetical protein